jgi:hypothetical protein
MKEIFFNNIGLTCNFAEALSQYKEDTARCERRLWALGVQKRKWAEARREREERK